MNGKRIILFTGSFLSFVLLWFFVFTTPESRSLAKKLLVWHQLIEPSNADVAKAIKGRFTITETGGIPKALLQRTVAFSYQWPDQLFLAAEVEDNTYYLSRTGEEIWINVPHKNMSICGANDVPRFSTRPDSIDPIELAAFSLPFSRRKLYLLPALVRVENETTNENGTIFRLSPKTFLANKLGIRENSTIEILVAKDSPNPVSIGVKDGKDLDVKVEFSEWDITEEKLNWTEWKGASDTGKTERVALSHLAKFVDVTLSHLDDRVEPLPPESGKREVLARSGKGRLENRDGTRVLYLKGTPEEMGKQHGNLLKHEIHEVTDRILYGIGVGSSFGKGRWFFGEIEEAVSRLNPYIDSRYLREMDAIASASGLETEEVRLSNFFPELFHCSGFAIHGSATLDGTMYHGRILDYMRGVGLEQNAVVMVVQPDEGNAWVNIGYASFVGTVTAMNEKRIAIGEMGGRGEGNWDGKPMAQLMREVMEKANTIEDAVAIMERGPRTCEYYYVISDGNSGKAVGIAATPEKFETIWSGATHEMLPHAVKDAVLMSSDQRYEELVRRVKTGHGKFDSASAIDLMGRPVCMTSNIQSVLFAPESLDFWVANADSDNVASETRFTKYNLRELLDPLPPGT